MMEQPFSLIPFPAPRVPSISITGKISLQNKVLSLHYLVEGAMERILLPRTSIHAGRKGELWQATCFEFFLAVKNQPSYWEFNLSPSGDWNVYHMDAYRRIGFREETCIQKLPFEIQYGEKKVSLNVVADISPVLPLDRVLECGITAVIQTTDGQETYWALTHPGSAPDFHLRESFILKLVE